MNDAPAAEVSPPLLARAPCPEDDPMRVVVFVSGNGGNLQSILDKAHQTHARFKVVLVVSNVPSVKALERAAKSKIPTVVENHREHDDRASFERALLAHCRRADAELVVLAGFMRVLTKTFVDGFGGRIVNIHPALCPAFPGLHAPRQALDHGARITGCTVHLIDTGVDTGPILAQAAVAIDDEETVDTLTAKIQGEEHRLLPRVVSSIAKGRAGGPEEKLRVVGLQATAPAITFE